jgi:hypothetical protein
MRYKALFLITIWLTITNPALAQTSVSDSVWCENLNNIIRCASQDEIYPEVVVVRDSTYIPAVKPTVHLTSSGNETIGKKYGKVTYEGYCYRSKTIDSKLLKELENWVSKTKACLDLWEVNRIDNQDKSLQQYKDYFITNSEDETTVRFDIFKGRDSYYVRLRIY